MKVLIHSFFKKLNISYSFKLCILYVNIIQTVIINEAPFRFLFYLPLCGFCVEVPEDYLSTDRNMLHSLKCQNWIKINVCCARLSKWVLFGYKHNGVSSIHIDTGDGTVFWIKRTEYTSYRTDGHIGNFRNLTRNVSRCACNNLSSEQSVCNLPLRPHARFQLLSELVKLQQRTFFTKITCASGISWHSISNRSTCFYWNKYLNKTNIIFDKMALCDRIIT